ncbi:hypothetical protein Prudu_000796, partial [Prunus dulcis]
CPRLRPSSLPEVAPVASLGVDLRDRCQTNQHTTADVSLPTSAAAVAGIGRNLPWKSTVRPNAIRTSSCSISSISQPNQSSEASEVQPISRRNLQRVVEVHRIHHRASLNLHASKSVGWKFLRSFTGENFGTGQNTGETLPNFRQKSKGILKRN